MKIGMISARLSYESLDLVNAGERRGHTVKIINPIITNLSDINSNIFIKSLLECDCVYYRNGLDISTKKVIFDFLTSNEILLLDKHILFATLFESKVLQLSFASNIGIRVPKTFSFSSMKPLFEDIVNKLGLPFIIKRSISSQGKDVYKISSEVEFDRLFADAKNTRINAYIYQEFIPNDGDYRIFVVGNKVLGIMKRIPSIGSFKANISQGATGEYVRDIKLIRKLSCIAEKITQAMKIDVAGVDIIISISNSKPYLIEINDSPQWYGFNKYTKIDVAEKIIEFMEVCCSNV